MDMSDTKEAQPLAAGEQAILKKLSIGPIDLRWGRNGWVPERLPKGARREDFDRICERHDLVKIELGQLVALANTLGEANE